MHSFEHSPNLFSFVIFKYFLNIQFSSFSFFFECLSHLSCTYSPLLPLPFFLSSSCSFSFVLQFYEFPLRPYFLARIVSSLLSISCGFWSTSLLKTVYIWFSFCTGTFTWYTLDLQGEWNSHCVFQNHNRVLSDASMLCGILIGNRDESPWLFLKEKTLMQLSGQLLVPEIVQEV